MATGRRTLLLADDSPTIQKVISLTFADEGMEVVAVGDGEQALRRLNDEAPPDILLADAVMPGPDGYRLCERVKGDERLRHIPVVLLVGTFEPFNEAEARRVGADTVLTKPFQSIRDLVNKVGSLLGGESRQEEEEEREDAGESSRSEVRRSEAPPASESAAPGAPARQPTPEAVRHASETDASFGHTNFGHTSEPASHFESASEPASPFEPASAARDERDTTTHADPSASFADIGADDEMIEATPAENFSSEQTTFGGERVEPETSASARATSERAPRAEYAETGFDARPYESRETNGHAVEPRSQATFAERAAGAVAADDALLDLGGIEPPAASAATEADDFILDLADDDEPPAASTHERSGAGEFTEFGGEGFETASADVYAVPDEAGAFAEAAHGDPSFHTEAHDEEARAHDPALVTEVIAQDEPQSFELSSGEGFEPHATYDAGERAFDFVEPEVVPAVEAAEPFAQGEFTDGSVEGDVAKPPASVEVEGFEMMEADVSHDITYKEPSTEGYSVGEARSGLDEAFAAREPAPTGEGRLSPEDVEAIARRVVELMSDGVVREVAWEVVPDLAEILINRRLDELREK